MILTAAFGNARQGLEAFLPWRCLIGKGFSWWTVLSAGSGLDRCACGVEVTAKPDRAMMELVALSGLSVPAQHTEACQHHGFTRAQVHTEAVAEVVGW